MLPRLLLLAKAWVVQHWRGLVGLALTLEPLVRFGKWLLNWLGSIDFLISRAGDPGWLATVFFFLADPPAWLMLPLMLTGMGLITWDYLRNRRVPVTASGPPLPAIAVEATTPGDNKADETKDKTTGPLERAVYVGRIEIDISGLEEHYTLQFRVFCFNPNLNTLAFNRQFGNIHMLFASLPGKTDQERTVILHTPNVRGAASLTLAPLAQSVITIEQKLPSGLAAALHTAFMEGEDVIFDFHSYFIDAFDLVEKTFIQVNLWDSMRCINSKERPSVTQQVSIGRVR